MARTMKKAASIRDVAALAEVSVSTVSRYLNNPERVSSEKRERIENAIGMLGFRPNPVARALVHKRLSSVAVFTTNTTLYGPSLVFEGIEDMARSEGLPLSICVLNGQDRTELVDSAQLYLDQHPSGVILLDFDNFDMDMSTLVPSNLPMVIVAGDEKPADNQVALATLKGGYTITKYLLDLGHRKVVHVAIPHEGIRYNRVAGWAQACSEYNAPIHSPIVADWNPDSGVAVGRRLGRDDTVTAVFAGNDAIALGIIRGLAEVGKKVPDDVSVVGFDDQPLSRIWMPGLTTYHMDFKESGRQAFGMLKSAINGGEPQPHVLIEGELVVRASTAAPRS